jgi:hypothetical protein
LPDPERNNCINFLYFFKTRKARITRGSLHTSHIFHPV